MWWNNQISDLLEALPIKILNNVTKREPITIWGAGIE